MFEYVFALAVAVVVFVIPATRRVAWSVLGLLGIAAIGIAGIGLPVWGLYEAKTWIIPQDATLSDVAAGKEGAGPGGKPAELEAAERRLREELERQAEEQRRLEEEQRHIAALAENARAVVERERRYLEVVQSSPRLPGLDRISTDLVAIRIPKWRDNELAEREQGQIRAWLHSIGLTPEETAGIHTANGWGSVYDLWRQETMTIAEGTAAGDQEPAAAVSEAPPAEPELQLEPEPPELPQATSALPERPAVRPRPQPRREATVTPRPAPARPRPPPREVGPFGY